MEVIFKNDTLEVMLNKSTNELHIRALKTENPHGMRSSMRIGVNSTGFDVTSDFCDYIPMSFGGLPGFRLLTQLKKDEI
jgi:hypothetical protein